MIIGGGENDVGEYPYMVSVLEEIRGNHFHFCGASLIAPDVILCAAHCVYKDQAHRVQIGKHLLSDNAEEVETYDVLEYQLCPEWDKSTYNCDVALVKLSGASEMRPVSLWEEGDDPLVVGEDLTVIGWGVTSTDNQLSPVLKDTTVGYYKKSKCNDKYFGTKVDRYHALCVRRRHGFVSR